MTTQEEHDLLFFNKFEDMHFFFSIKATNEKL